MDLKLIEAWQQVKFQSYNRSGLQGFENRKDLSKLQYNLMSITLCHQQPDTAIRG